MKRFRTRSLLAPVLGGLLLVGFSQTTFAREDQDAAPHPINGQAQLRLDPAVEVLGGFIGHWNVNLIMRNNDQSAQAGDGKPSAPSDLKSGYAMYGTQTIWPVQHGTALMGRLVMNSSDQKNSFEGHIFITPAENDSSADIHGPKNTSSAPDNQNAAADNPKHYSVFWSDSTGHTSFTKDATWDGTQLTILSDENFHSKNLRTRVTWTRVSAERIDVTMDRDTGNGWTREFSSNYNRAPRNPAHGAMNQGQAAASGLDQGNSNAGNTTNIAPSSR